MNGKQLCVIYGGRTHNKPQILWNKNACVFCGSTEESPKHVNIWVRTPAK